MINRLAVTFSLNHHPEGATAVIRRVSVERN